ncbi:MAG: ATP-binding protein [Gemmataceae bacterium]
MPRLVVTEGVDEGREFDLVDPIVVIGRDSSSTIRLLDTEVSRRHAELRASEDGNGYSLHDTASANGVFLNGRAVTGAGLRAGDRIQIGRTTLVYGGVPGEPSDSIIDEPFRVVTRPGDDLPSSIIQSIDAAEGSQILTRPEDENSAWLRTRLANLAIMYEAIQAVSHILDIDELLKKILELLFRSVEADRGCILLRNSNEDPLVPRAVRWRETGGPRGEIAVSRTIIDHVLRQSEGVLVTDAGRDDRFAGGASVVRFGIREAICVPMAGRHETVGVLYFDTFRATTDGESSRFTEDHLSLAVAVAHQAAIAVEETRYYQAKIQSERLAAVGQAITSLSHHIKNIVQGMQSGADVLKLGINDKDDVAVQTGWRLIEKNQGRIYDVVLDMLSYSKEREPALEPYSPEKIVRDIAELMRGRAAEHGASLTVESEPTGLVLLDPEGIHRAVLNLVGNAIDAVESCTAPKVTIRVAMNPDRQWLTIAVQDNGVGIEPERMAKLFRPFESTKGSRGTGLGLAVSRKIVREHGGDISVTSHPNVGSEFTIRVPLNPAP